MRTVGSPVRSGTIPGGGQLQITLNVPNNSALIGLEVFGQGIVAEQGGGDIYFTNPDCKTIDS